MWRWVQRLSTLIVLSLGSWFGVNLFWRVERPIRVGILHSQTGPLRISEQSKGLFDQPDTDLQSLVTLPEPFGDLIPLTLDGHQTLPYLVHSQPAFGR